MGIRTMLFFFGYVVISVASLVTTYDPDSCSDVSLDRRQLAARYVKKLRSELRTSVSILSPDTCTNDRILKHIKGMQSTLGVFQAALTENDCFTDSTTYIGKRNCTISGYTCMAWHKRDPHDHHHNVFPDGSITQAGNYCRDPDGGGYLWCYTTDYRKRYDKCGVPACDKFQ